MQFDAFASQFIQIKLRCNCAVAIKILRSCHNYKKLKPFAFYFCGNCWDRLQFYRYMLQNCAFDDMGLFRISRA